MKTAILNVNGVNKLSTEIDYDDLVWLYQDYINRTGKVPRTMDGLTKNNLPQCRIIKSILENNNITMNDFLNQFGKYSHVRSNLKHYDLYVQKYTKICQQLGRVLLSSELTNNSWGLPNAGWLIKNCPNKDVQTYGDFINWCGLDFVNSKRDKDDIVARLYDLEAKLGRPITRKDITKDNVGFSMIVINRIWGGLNKCKVELGLLSTSTSHPRPFEYYKQNLDLVLDDFKKTHNRQSICWNDIENSSVSCLEHKSLTKAFKREGLDVIGYIKSHGLTMNPSLFSFHHTFDDGEITVSSYEYDFSQYLRQCGYIYNKTYYRNVMYKTLCPESLHSKINCDYVLNGVWIEIAGIISNINNDWESHTYSSRQEQNYQRQLKEKKRILDNNNIPYVFLFPEDFKNDKYKQVVKTLIGKEVVYA